MLTPDDSGVNISTKSVTFFGPFGPQTPLFVKLRVLSDVLVKVR